MRDHHHYYYNNTYEGDDTTVVYADADPLPPVPAGVTDGVDGGDDGLSAAELQFVVGLTHYRSGRYEQAVESFAASVREAPNHPVARFFLGVSEFAIGDFRASADSFRVSLASWPLFSTYQWDLRGLYEAKEGQAVSEDYKAQLAALETQVGANPQNPDAQLVRAVVLYVGGEPEASRSSLEYLGAVARGTPFGETVTKLDGAAQARVEGKAATPPNDTVQAFLTSLGAAEVPGLNIR
ncbi:MAG: tetratricopeptide repeat protein [Planctomycetota bacterium]